MFFNVQSCVPCLHRPESLEPKTEGGPLKGSPRSSASLDSKESASFLSSPVSDSSLDDGGKAADADRLVKELKSQASSVGVPQKMVNLKEAKTCLEEALKEALEKTHIVNPFVDYIWVMPLTDFKPSVSEETVSRVIEEAVKVIDAVESGIMSSVESREQFAEDYYDNSSGSIDRLMNTLRVGVNGVLASQLPEEAMMWVSNQGRGGVARLSALNIATIDGEFIPIQDYLGVLNSLDV